MKAITHLKAQNVIVVQSNSIVNAVTAVKCRAQLIHVPIMVGLSESSFKMGKNYVRVCVIEVHSLKYSNFSF